ncbi:MAG: hypothetical protein NVS3B12_25540 [Acidimicrobiales bacterium]
MLVICIGGFVLPALVGVADRGAGPPASPTPPARVEVPADHDPRPDPPGADAALLVGVPPAAGVALNASDTGVTATTVRIGVILPSLGSVSAFGIDVSQLDPKNQRTYWDAAVARVNDRGGIGGRRLELDYAIGDILSQDSMRAACRTLTEDRKVFAVANVLGVTGDPVLCVTRDHATPYLGIDGADPSYYPLSAGRLVTLEPDVGTTLRIFLDRVGPELAGRTVGVVHPGGSNGIDAGALRGALLAHGAKAVIDGTLGEQDPLVVSGQVAAAERRMQQGGADVVVLLTNAVYGTVFATQADQSRYTPTYLMSDLGYATAGDSFLANMPPAFFHRALAVTTTEVGRGRAHLPESPRDAGCRHDFERVVNKVIDRDSADGTAAVASCALVQLVTMGLNAAGTNPTRAAFSDALSRAGTFPLPGFGRAILGDGRTGAAAEVSMVAAHADCQCYFVVDGFRPIGP